MLRVSFREAACPERHAKGIVRALVAHGALEQVELQTPQVVTPTFASQKLLSISKIFSQMLNSFKLVLWQAANII
jgi:hypothetical protein